MKKTVLWRGMKILCAFMAFAVLLCGVSASGAMTAEAAGASPTSESISKTTGSGQYWQSSVYPYYQVSPHYYSSGSAGGCFLMVPTKSSRYTWTASPADGWDASVEANYEAVYCVDTRFQEVQSGGVVYFDRQPIESYSLFLGKTDKVDRLKTIAFSAYPFVTAEAFAAELEAAGVEVSENCGAAEYISAAQLALWKTENPSYDVWIEGVDYRTSEYRAKHDHISGTLKNLAPLTEWGTDLETVQADVEAITEYLLTKPLCITAIKDAAVGALVPCGDGTCETDVTVTLARTPDSESDLTARVAVDGRDDLSFETKFTAGEPSAVVHLTGVSADAASLSVTVTGTETAPQAFVYRSKSDDYTSDRDQNMIGCEMKHTHSVSLEKIILFDSRTMDFVAEKQWKGTTSHPDSVEATLLKNGEPYGEKVTLSSSGDWQYIWTDLPAYDASGEEIEYSIREMPVSGYNTTYSKESVDITSWIPADKLTNGAEMLFAVNDGSQKTLLAFDKNKGYSYQAVSDEGLAYGSVPKGTVWKVVGNDSDGYSFVNENGSPMYYLQTSYSDGSKYVFITKSKNSYSGCAELKNIKLDEENRLYVDCKGTRYYFTTTAGEELCLYRSMFATFTPYIKTSRTVEDGSVIYNYKAAQSVTVNKLDAAGENELSGAKLAVYDAEGVKKAEWTSAIGEVWNLSGLARGTYTLREIGGDVTDARGESYGILSSVLEFTVDSYGRITAADADKSSLSDGKAGWYVDGSAVYVCDAKKVPLDLHLNKYDLTGEKELAGAVLTITDKTTSEKKYEWTSVIGEEWTVTAIPDGEYTLRESGATVTDANGDKYDVLAAALNFTVADGQLFATGTKSSLDEQTAGYFVSDNTIAVCDAKRAPTVLHLNKYDLTGEKELAGAVLTITDKTTGEKKYEWMSVIGEEWTITAIPDGEYTLRESGTAVTDANGDKYDVLDASLDFTVADGQLSATGNKTSLDEQTAGYFVSENTIFVCDAKRAPTVLRLNKYDLTGEKELAGAVLTITDKNTGEKKYEWTSVIGEEWTITGIPDGTYTLRESGTTVTDANGDKYDVLAAALDFTVSDGQLSAIGNKTSLDEQTAGYFVSENTVFVCDAKRAPTVLHLNKFDLTGEKELAGAVLTITDKTTGEKKYEWTSVIGEEWTITAIPDGTYTLRESGATVTDANGDKYDVLAAALDFTVVDGKLSAIGNKKTVSEAKTGYCVSGNTICVCDAKRTAEPAPDEPTPDEPTPDEPGDEPTPEAPKPVLHINKFDITGQNELADALLEICVKETGAKKYEWISEIGRDWTLTDIPDGVYILREAEAPAGYAKAADITFRCENGSAQILSDEGWTDAENNTIAVRDERAVIEYQVAFVKFSGLGTTVTGAVFKLEDGKGNVMQATSDANGIVAFTKVPSGEYTLSEESAPVNYIRSSSTVIMKVDTRGTVSYYDRSGRELTATEVEKTFVNELVPKQSDEPQTVRVGQTIDLKKNLDEKVAALPLDWDSSDREVIDVTDDGLATVKAPGESTVTAEHEGKQVYKVVLGAIDGGDDDWKYGELPSNGKSIETVELVKDEQTQSGNDVDVSLQAPNDFPMTGDVDTPQTGDSGAGATVAAILLAAACAAAVWAASRIRRGKPLFGKSKTE